MPQPWLQWGEIMSVVNSLCVDPGLKTYFGTLTATTLKPVSTVGTTPEGTRASRTWPWPEHGQDKNHEEDGGEGHQSLRQEVGILEVQGKRMRASYDVSGAALDPELVVKARQLETDYCRQMGVYHKVQRRTTQQHGGNTIGTRWIDINKGNEKMPD